MIRTILAMLALAVASPAFAQAQQTERFEVTGVEISLPTPKGFCRPQGQAAIVAQLTAASDDSNVTNLTLYRCGDESEFLDYYILKTTKTLLMLSISRADFIAGVVESLDDPAVKAAVDPARINPEIERNLDTLFGVKGKIGGEIRWLGHDDSCVYLGGVMRLESQGGVYTRAVSGCMTAVGGRAVNLYRYSAGEAANVTKYLPELKAMALSMQGAPAH
ncbi:hypothetical protein P6144_13980 [Sphingomonas sp. HITSZ_GF]|uniref:hypothetical protein n=1 Tax=Sphingomonas sp. HITSZ_GF TaxID=3037247 RepID=UPI00240D7710|nr:hypothetical protein [Sphingomonas sp. HITSZ_GF]MDG2534767.1 hypothetical protein [Sphingomonas sp. HITSZ_GF]